MTCFGSNRRAGITRDGNRTRTALILRLKRGWGQVRCALRQYSTGKETAAKHQDCKLNETPDMHHFYGNLSTLTDLGV